VHAIVVGEGGTPEAMKWAEVPDAVVGPGEVLIRVAAAGINRADLLQRQGFYPPPPGAPEWMGLECSGVVTALGTGVSSVAVGDEVCCLLAGGGYAELVAVPIGQVMTIPRGVDLVSAAGLAEVACTVWSNLMMVTQLQAGEWLLIHGGGSGIGTMAIQIARMVGARVAVTAGSERKLQMCADLGAEVLINYREQDFVEEIRKVTGGRGADVIFDNMGASYLARNIDSLAPDGRLVIIGMQGGVKAELDINALLLKRGTLHATSLRARPLDQKADICEQVQRFVWPWIEAGLVVPVIDRIIPIKEVAAGHTALKSGEATGKILLTV